LDVAQRDPGIQGGCDERMSERVGRDGLGDPRPAGGLADDPPGPVPVYPPPVGGHEQRAVRAFADGQVDGPGGAWRQRDGDDLAALIRTIELSLRADSVPGGRRQVSTVPPRTLESYRKIVPLPVTGRVDRCWDVVPARMGVSTVLLGR
jgi:hypothetical protein